MMDNPQLESTVGISAINAIRREIFVDGIDSTSPLKKTLTENEILQLVRQRLQSSVYIAIRGIKATLDEGKLYFFGTVPTFYTKQVLLSLAEDLGRDVVQIVDKTIVLKH